MSIPTMRIPRIWDQEAHRLYCQGKLEAAVNKAIQNAAVNVALFVQACYYTFMHKDYAAALCFATEYLKRRPDDVEMLNNASACCTRLHKYREAIGYSERVLALTPDNSDVYDALAHAYGRLRDMDKAAEAGTRALLLKDRDVSRKHSLRELRLPSDSGQFLKDSAQKKPVCAFSLFGDNPRYLRGALSNALAGKELYPGWILRYYVDETVPEDFRNLLKSLGAELVLKDAGVSAGMKLCWRFLVASDQHVGRFVVRDCDASFSLREALVVDEWIGSGKLFHVIRDWYTHTDLMLAGLWGGHAGILPDMQALLDEFFATSKVLTPNIDQLFLAEYLWPVVRESCLVHDRYFDAFAPRRPPMRYFRMPNDHIGADRHVTDRAWQETFLNPWIKLCPCLGGGQGERTLP